MSQFSYQANQSQPLSSLLLTIGEEAQPIVLKAVSPTDAVQSAYFLQQVPLVLVDSLPVAPGFEKSIRLLSLTGRRKGGGPFRAVAPPGDGKPLAEFGVNVRDVDDKSADLIYTGKHLYWYRSVPKMGGSGDPLLFAATSGNDVHRNERYQNVEDFGPMPEGTYTFATSIDPNQNSAEAANRRGDVSVHNYEEGIQFLRMSGGKPVDDNWGTLRVRLMPRTGNMFGRAGGFYLHNSEKGSSHGCLEVGQTLEGLDFFTMLMSYAGEPGKKPRLVLRVKYSYPGQSTAGKTQRTLPTTAPQGLRIQP